MRMWDLYFAVPIFPNAFKTCALHCGLSIYEKKGKLNRFRSYLTPDDMETLKQTIIERAELHNALDTISIQP